MPQSVTILAPSPVVVTGYRSPYGSPQSYADEFSNLQPLGWYSLAALSPSGILHSVGRGIMAGIAALDSEVQLAHEQLRLLTCRTMEVDTWAADYVGWLFQRYPDETDQFYVPRLKLMIGKQRITINALTLFVGAWLNSITYGLWNQSTSGKIDQYVVWDIMTNPAQSAAFGVIPGQVVVQIGDITGFPPSQKLTTTPPDYRLGLLLNMLAKAGGVQVLYYVQPGIQWL